MKIWQIEIGTEKGGANVDVVDGVAETAWEAINKAMRCAKEQRGLKDPYPSRVTEIGEQVF